MAIDTRTGKGYAESHYLDILRLTSKYYWNTKEGKETIPTFTLQSILEILSKIKHYYYPNLRQVNNMLWQIIYKPKLGELEWIAKYDKTPIEAAFEMLKYCKQNNML